MTFTPSNHIQLSPTAYYRAKGIVSFDKTLRRDMKAAEIMRSPLGIERYFKFSDGAVFDVLSYTFFIRRR